MFLLIYLLTLDCSVSDTLTMTRSTVVSSQHN